MRNSRATGRLQQGAEGLITLAAMRAAADSVRTQHTPTNPSVHVGSCISPKIISLIEEVGSPSGKDERVFA